MKIKFTKTQKQTAVYRSVHCRMQNNIATTKLLRRHDLLPANLAYYRYNF